MSHTWFTPGNPTPQGSKNARVVNGKAIMWDTNRNNKQWRNTIHRHARTQWKKPVNNPVAVDLVFHMPRTKKQGNKPAPPMIQRPDLDKLVRAVLDGLTGVVYTDDAQVTRLTAIKQRTQPGHPTGVAITITPAYDNHTQT